jgi:NitT/TauT family transport system ATP-binding protein
VAFIEIRDLNKSYKDSQAGNIEVLENLSIDINKGEFVSIFGPNGSGKTTLLNIVSGLINYDSGSVLIGGKKPADSKIGFMFQNYIESLFPWLENISNIGFSLDSSYGTKKQRENYIQNFLNEMGLGELPLHKYPYQCSAGQQQLVALSRELIYKPDVLLMDEPFVSLDYDRRISQQEYLLNSCEKTNATVLFVSHEIDEAIYLSDRIILLSQRPAKMFASYKITLPRPRKIEMLGQQAFFELKVPILHDFMRLIDK